MPHDASTNSIQLLGEFEATVSFNSTNIICCILVSSIPALNLFGSDLIDKFQLWDKPIDTYTSCNNINLKGSLTPADLRKQFPDVFREKIGHVKSFKIHLPLKQNATPIFRPKRQVAYAVKQSLEETLDTLEREGIITPINYSEWAAPIVVVKKSSGMLRICGDYSTGLNDQLEPHNFPLPLPDDIFVNFNNCSLFSIIDLNNAYMQLEVDDETKKLLVVNTHRGLYTFNRLAQGVKSAPGAFQQAIQTILSGIEGAYPYLDDVIIATRTREQNEKVVKQVLERLKIYNMTVNFEKCKFFKTSCTYLGYYINSNGISPDKNKIKQIRELPPPQNVAQLRSYLGAVNYYSKFLPEMRKLRDPLDNLLKKNVKWNWSKQCQQSFQRFKELLSSELLLTHYDPRLQIKVAADASNEGLGAYICHVFSDGSEKAIYHCSRSLTPAEKNYSQIEKEALALVFAIVKFHKYIYGRRFILQTDHKPLLAIFSNKKGIPAHSANRLQRWALTLMSYDFELQYVSTDNFGAADILSRLINNVPKSNEDTVVACVKLEKAIKLVIENNTKALPITFNMIKDATAKDDELQNLVTYLKSGKWPKNLDSNLKCYFSRKENLSIASDCLMYGDRIIIPKCFRTKILKELHKGHDGIDRTKMLARSYVYWPQIDQDIKKYVQECSNCSLAAKTLPKTTLHSWPMADRPMQRTHIDIAGPVENFYYFIMVDAFSKWPQIYQIKSISSSTILECLKEFTSAFGNPELIVSDNGTQFSSQTFAAFCLENGIKHIFTPPYHPQSNGQAERFVDTMKRALKKLEGTGNAKQKLNTFLQCYRSAPNKLTGKTPSELFVGRKIRINLDLLKKPNPDLPIRNQQMESQFNNQYGAKPRAYDIGQKVLAKIYKQNEEKWTPGIIVKKLGKVMYEVKLKNPLNLRTTIRSHTNQLKPDFSNYPDLYSSPSNELLDYFSLQPISFNPIETLNQPEAIETNQSERMETSQPEIEQHNLDIIAADDNPDINTTNQQFQCTQIEQPIHQSESQDQITQTNQLNKQHPYTQPLNQPNPSNEQTTQNPQQNQQTSSIPEVPNVASNSNVELRRSSRSRKPPFWAPYYITKTKGDVGNTKE